MKGYKKTEKSKLVSCSKCNKRLIRRYATNKKSGYYTPFDWYCSNCNKTILDSEIEISDSVKKKRETRISKGIGKEKGYKATEKSRFIYCIKCNIRLIRRSIKSTETGNYAPFDWLCIGCNATILDSEVIIAVVNKILIDKNEVRFKQIKKDKSNQTKKK